MDISIVIPTYNRVSLLPKLLDTWREVDKATKYQYEIIFSDDGSTDHTVSTLKQHADGLPLVILENEHGGVARARNSAIRLAKGDKILMTGDDIFPNPQMINQHYELSLKLGPDTAILGEITWHPELELNYLMTHITEVGHEQFSFNAFPPHEYVDFRHFYTSNISIDRQLLLSEQVLFDERFYKVNFEDTELAYRLSKKGMKILFEPEAWASHYHPYTIGGFCKRQETAGEMAVVLVRLHPELDKFVGVERAWERYSKFRSSRLAKIPALSQGCTDCDAIIKICETYEQELPLSIGRERRFIKLALSSLYSRLFRSFFELGILKKLDPDGTDYKDYLTKTYFDSDGYWNTYLETFDAFKDLKEADRDFRERVLLSYIAKTSAEMHVALVDRDPQLALLAQTKRELATSRTALGRIKALLRSSFGK